MTSRSKRIRAIVRRVPGPVKGGTGPKKFPTKAWDSSKPPGANLPKDESPSDSR